MAKPLNHVDLSLALAPPLLVRFAEDDAAAIVARLGLMFLVFLVVYAWSAVFARKLGQTPASSQVSFVMLYVLLLPEPVGWFGSVLAVSFGWVFGHEIFSGKAILSPALVALAFAIFSFPQAGYETQLILTSTPSLWTALACLPGAAWLSWRGILPWRIALGAMLGTAVVSRALAPADALVWWQHYLLGSFAAGVLFLAAAPENAPRFALAQWLNGATVGALIIIIRLTDPQQPDGVVFAALLGGLFAPLLDRAVSWRLRRE